MTGTAAAAGTAEPLRFPPGPPPAAAEEWSTASPEEAGFASDFDARLDAALDDEVLDGLHAVLVVRGGRLVYERYLTGDDEIWGRRKQGVAFGPDSLHDVRSNTKSVVSLLYGIALGDDTVPPPEAPVLDHFPEYADLAQDPARRAITMQHVLSMTMGTEWDEDIPYSDPANSEIAMNRASDSLRFVLDRPLQAQPGEAWTYNGGATAIAAALIARRNGGDLAAFARERLFEPLGIERIEWITDYYGVPYAASGLRLRPRDSAKIGQLVLQKGVWEGQQVVPADWIEASTSVHTPGGYGCDYGYFWWLCQLGTGHRMIEASGNGGQEVLILPELDLVMVVNAGRYNDPDVFERIYTLLEEVVIPAAGRP
ncbi:hypothetical protein OCH239_18585 [Roseivivax halodurans JCM 10272]|uniref:Beta-lactamase-related domain-containing protein n=1 Tax=Roseivivax halodurans JCM 10272 TaxID=1449350 RepID=X7EA74_9RHOB|nr:hypothetical protein OCH239_18585 [Roseivivax halodurans JCM 10272]